MEAEDRIIASARSGTIADLTDLDHGQRHVDPEFLRRLYSGRHPDAPAEELHPEGPTVVGAVVTSPFRLVSATTVIPVRLHDCDLAGIFGEALRAPHLSFRGSTCKRLDLNHAVITGSVHLDRFVCDGRISAGGVRIGGDLSLRDASLSGAGSGGAANVLLDRAEIAGSVFLDEKFLCAGQVRAGGTRIGGQLVAHDATFTSCGVGDAAPLMLASAQVGGDVVLDGRFRCAGELRAHGARIGGQLVLRDATLTSAAEAVTLDGAEIAGDVLFDGVFRCDGRIRAGDARIGGLLGMSGATLTNTGWGATAALLLDGAAIGGGVMLGEGFSCAGQMRAIATRIAGQLQMDGAVFTSAGTDVAAAVMLDDADISGSAILNVNCAGQLRLSGTRIGGELNLRGAELRGSGTGDDAPLILDRAAIAGEVFLDGAFSCAGQIRTLGANTGVLHDDPTRWTDGSAIDGFTYKITLRGIALSRSIWAVERRRPWLDRCDFAPSAYRHLASLYRAHGYPNASDRILIAMRQRQRKHLPRWRRPWDWLYDKLTRYGLRPSRLLVPLLATVAVVVLPLAYPAVQNKLVATTPNGAIYTARGHLIVPAPTATGAPVAHGHCVSGTPVCFNPWWYALDAVVPIVDLGQRSTWRVDSSQPKGSLLEAGLNVARLLGWFFSAVLAVVLGRLTQARD